MSTDNLTIRTASTADAAAIVRLVQSAYRGDSGRLGWTTESDFLDGQRTDLEEVQGNIERAGSRILLALTDADIVGCCHVERDGTAAYFGMFAVVPTGQGLGVGHALLTRAETVARDELGCVSMKMSVIDLRTELIGFYERRGYVRTGQYKAFPYGDERFGVPRRDDLRFAWLAKLLATA
jgi:ribosomal protein S18 acetylase RimI-like enzyme